MKLVVDLHIHSPYARAVSKAMTLENLDRWARIKGINIMGTGDFTHPAWIKEIKGALKEAEPGLYTLKKKISEGAEAVREQTRFLLTVEVSSIYSKNGRVRRVHTLIFAPSIAVAEKINAVLGSRGNIRSDGRPILGIDAKDLLKIVLDIDPACVVVPAHVWTPWFSVFGSKSGFDTLEECYEEYTSQIFALETGLSSDPVMNWRVSNLDAYALISNSDSHSLRRIGREANILEAERSYCGVMDAIRSKDPARFLSTIEFFPEEGMYHYDGHRACDARMLPEETRRLDGRCPRCGKAVTVGVLNRVESLADRPESVMPKRAIPFKNMVPLDEIIAEAFGLASPASKKVQQEYFRAIQEFGTEIAILFDVPIEELTRHLRPEVAEGVKRVREGRLYIEPGYDGVYGTVRIFRKEEPTLPHPQKTLFG